MSGGYIPQRPSSHSDCSSPEIPTTQDVRLHYLETRVERMERTQETTARDMTQIKTEIKGVHNDLNRLTGGIQKTEAKITSTIGSASSLAKWLCGLICSIGLALGLTMLSMCRESSTQTTRTQTIVEDLSEDVRGIQVEFETLRRFLLLGPKSPQ